VLFDRSGGDISLGANNDVRLLVLSGEPIDEPVVMQGPFVMSTADEISQAMADFRGGRFGVLADLAAEG
jgi:redox-sensitive bicupin YhaK (pirin superfamily)